MDSDFVLEPCETCRVPVTPMDGKFWDRDPWTGLLGEHTPEVCRKLKRGELLWEVQS